MKKLPKHTFGIGAEVYHYQYMERVNTTEVMRDRGVFGGVDTHYTYHGENKLMLRPEFRAAWAAVDYYSDYSGSIPNVDQYVIETRMLAGYDLYLHTSMTALTFYTGFGYRFLHDGGGGHNTTFGAVGYDRESNYYYTPFGIEGLKDLENGWMLGGTAEFDLLWKGIQRSKLSTAVGLPGWEDTTSDQNRGFGLRFSVKAMKKSKWLDFSVEPFYRLWKIDKGIGGYATYYGTRQAEEFYEPKNSTDEIGVKMMFEY